MVHNKMGLLQNQHRYNMLTPFLQKYYSITLSTHRNDERILRVCENALYICAICVYLSRSNEICREEKGRKA